MKPPFQHSALEDQPGGAKRPPTRMRDIRGRPESTPLLCSGGPDDRSMAGSMPGVVRLKKALRVGPRLAETLGDLWRGYRKQLKKCQRDFSENNVHELRVRTRRLMAKLYLLGWVLSHRAVDRAQGVLKRRLKALGGLRDTQVQLAFIDERLAESPELVKLRAWLARRERRLVDDAARQIRRCRLGKLAKWLAALRRRLSRQAKDAVRQYQFAAAATRATSRAFDEAVRRRQAVDRSDLATIHRTRVAYKKFRYMVESIPPELARKSKRQLAAMAGYQRMMGDIQDVEVLQACIAEFGRDEPKAAPELRAFRRYLTRRRAQLVRTFLQHADALYDFWPPPGADRPPASPRPARRVRNSASRNV